MGETMHGNIVCECSSVVERYLAKVDVEGSSPFTRSRFVEQNKN